MSKLWASTRFCAFSMARVIRRCSMGSPSSMPSAHDPGDALATRTCAAGRPPARGRTARSPGPPGARTRPRSWLSMRRRLVALGARGCEDPPSVPVTPGRRA